MSYNEIPNILVDIVVLQNKPLSNHEIIDAAKKAMDLEEYFWETLSLKKRKLNECGILNLDSSSGDFVHCVMSFKKGKDTFYFDSYGVQPPSELIAYRTTPNFYNSERVQQNGEVFCGHLCLFTLKQFSLGNNLQTVIYYLI